MGYFESITKNYRLMVKKIKLVDIKELTDILDNESNYLDGIDVHKLFVNSSKEINWK